MVWVCPTPLKAQRGEPDRLDLPFHGMGLGLGEGKALMT